MGAKLCLFRKKEQIYNPSKAKFVYGELSLRSFGNVDKVRFERNMVRIMMGSFTANTEEMKEEKLYLLKMGDGWGSVSGCKWLDLVSAILNRRILLVTYRLHNPR